MNLDHWGDTHTLQMCQEDCEEGDVLSVAFIREDFEFSKEEIPDLDRYEIIDIREVNGDFLIDLKRKSFDLIETISALEGAHV